MNVDTIEDLISRLLDQKLSEILPNESVAVTPTPQPTQVATIVVSQLPKFSGDHSQAQMFIYNIQLLFHTQPNQYPDKESKFAYVMSLLRGDAFKWMTLLLQTPNHPALQTFDSFVAEFLRRFKYKDQYGAAVDDFYALKQGNLSVSQFATALQNICVHLPGYGDNVMRDYFLRRVNEDIKDVLVCYPRPNCFADAVALCVNLETYCHARRCEKEARRQLRQFNPGMSPVDQKPTRRNREKASLLD